ncbi:hypothetical protein J6590_107074, partial [Homalodisca vitripennis]
MLILTSLGRVTTEEALNGFEVALRFVEQSPTDATPTDLLLLKDGGTRRYTMRRK